jgi:hypothetical protein
MRHALITAADWAELRGRITGMAARERLHLRRGALDVSLSEL